MTTVGRPETTEPGEIYRTLRSYDLYDQDHVLIVDEVGSVRLVNRTGQALWRTGPVGPSPADHPESPEVHVTGRRILLFSRNGYLAELDAATGDATVVARPAASPRLDGWELSTDYPRGVVVDHEFTLYMTGVHPRDDGDAYFQTLWRRPLGGDWERVEAMSRVASEPGEYPQVGWHEVLARDGLVVRVTTGQWSYSVLDHGRETEISLPFPLLRASLDDEGRIWARTQVGPLETDFRFITLDARTGQPLFEWTKSSSSPQFAWGDVAMRVRPDAEYPDHLVIHLWRFGPS